MLIYDVQICNIQMRSSDNFFNALKIFSIDYLSVKKLSNMSFINPGQIYTPQNLLFLN